MKFAPHLSLERGIDKLVLTHPRKACEGGGNDARPIVVAVAGEVLDNDLGVGEAILQNGFQLGLGDGHDGSLPLRAPKLNRRRKDRPKTSLAPRDRRTLCAEDRHQDPGWVHAGRAPTRLKSMIQLVSQVLPSS